MSWAVKPISIIVEPEKVWAAFWAGTHIDDQPQPASVCFNTHTPFSPNFCQPYGTKTDDFGNSFYNRAPKWVADSTGGPRISDLSIIAGTNVGVLSEPFTVNFDGTGDWTVLTPDVISTLGDRSIYIKREQYLPLSDPRSLPASELNFEYQRQVTLINLTVFPPPTITLTYYFSMLGSELLEYQGLPYIQFRHGLNWFYTDDGGSSQGGFLSDISDLPSTSSPTFAEYGSNLFTTSFRMGGREYQGINHLAFPFVAYEYRTTGADGLGLTSTLPINEVQLEVGGLQQSASAWFQPDSAGSEPYFGFRKKNDDDSTAIYDTATGHLLIPEPQFPSIMVRLQ